MYKPRFRHRNALITGGLQRVLHFVKPGDCSTTAAWSVYSSGNSTRVHGTVEYIDDIAGDPPMRKAGVSGFRFHPMTKVKCELEGVGFGSWNTVMKAQSCGGTPNAYYEQWKTDRYPGYDWNLAMSGYQHKMLGDRLDLSLYPIPWEDLQTSKDLAATRALSQRGRHGESNLYESLAEIRKSAMMFNDILVRAKKIQDHLFTTKYRGKARMRSLTEEAAGQLLMTNYGWKPLVSDVIGILNSLEKTIGAKTIFTRAKHENMRVTNTSLPDVSDSDTVIFSRSESTTERWVARAVSVDQATVTALQNLGLGLKDLLLVPWELIRYSHVVDWFLNVGDLLGSLVQDPSLLNIGQSMSIRYERDDVLTFSLVGLKPSLEPTVTLISANAPPTLTRRLTYYNREVGALVPRLRFRTEPLGLEKTLNALAMFTVATASVKSKLVHVERRRSVGRYEDELPRGAWRDYHWAK